MFLVTACGLAGATGCFAAELAEVGVHGTEGGTRLELVVTGFVTPKVFTLGSPDRLVVDFPSTRALHPPALKAPEGLVRAMRLAAKEDGSLRVVFDLTAAAASHLESSVDAIRHTHWIIDLTHSAAPAALASVKSSVVTTGAPVVASPSPATVRSAPAAPAAVPVPLRTVASAPVGTRAAGARQLMIAVDAGHGGEDPGASGRDGTHEKDVTLAIARVLAARINAEPGFRAVLTRDTDVFVPLRERSRRARVAQADMFVSVHADAVPDRSVAGASVYVLSAHGASSEAAKWLADRENAADLVGGVSLEGKDHILASVLLDLSQSAAMSASMSAAEQVIAELNQVGEVRKTRVQQAGFMVLKSPDIPSMLIETAYITNPDEEHRLADPGYQAKLAEAIVTGIHRYFRDSAPPGARLASLAATR